MAADTLAELKRELRAELAGVNALDVAAQAKLLELLRAAHAHQRRELEQALDQVLDHVPALLRGPARMIFFHE
jgi:hypothetical protein